MKGVCGGLALVNSQTPTQPLVSAAMGRSRKWEDTGMRKLVGGDEDREMPYQLPLWAEQTCFVED